MNMCIEGIRNKDAPSSIPPCWLSWAIACDREGTSSYVLLLWRAVKTEKYQKYSPHISTHFQLKGWGRGGGTKR